jgi:hypothetical protein
MFVFGDSFDLYAAMADAIAGYWDSGTVNTFVLNAGRFTGSQALRAANVAVGLVKSSGNNDAIHHIVVAFQQTAALSGTTLGEYFTLGDGATAQCSIVFRSDGAILLTSGGPTGTVLATFATGVNAQNTWFAFEFEVVINNTTGSFAVRRNGNTVNDFSATALNTRGGTANNYVNRLSVGANAVVSNQLMDDLLWRSDPTAVMWVGDVRCYVRLPSTDVSVQFARFPTAPSQSIAQTTTSTMSNTVVRYSPLVANFDGTVNSISVSLGTGFTGNMKCALYASSGTAPTTVLGTATPINNPVTGANVFTFPTPVSVTKGTQYWVAVLSDVSSGILSVGSGVTGGQQTSASYATFPVNNPPFNASVAPFVYSVPITITKNAAVVADLQQDGGASYVYSSNPTDVDLYGIAAIAATPLSIVAVTTRGFVQKSDAGSRSGAIQIKSGTTTVASPTTALSTGFSWLYRTDLNDPATGSAWLAGGVNNLQIGPTVIS